MTIAAHPQTISRPSAGGIFSLALIVATVLPFCSIGITHFAPSTGAIAGSLIIISATHVLTTAYLLADQEVRRFFGSHPIKMIAIPVGLVAGGMVLFSQVTGAALTVCFAPFFLYQAWHFGAQNLGVSTFISIFDRGRPLARFEKIVIKFGIVAGILGVLRSMATVFPSANLGGFGSRLIEFSYFLGLATAVPLTAAALWLMIRACREGHFLFGASIFLSVCFLFPMYLTHDYVLGYISFTVAHGLQYLIFLIAHCAGQRRGPVANPRFAKLAAPAILVSTVLIGNFIFNSPAVKALPTIGLAIGPALTLAHFWVDLFLWRMRDKDRAAWVRMRFGFVLQ